LDREVEAMGKISQNRIPIHITAQAIMFCVIFLCYPQLSAQVDTAWVRTYNGSGEQWDRGVGVEVDREGNIYVLGQANSDEVGNGDIVVMKYTPEGETIWARIYDAPGENSRDLPVGIASDSLGNVYVSEITNYVQGNDNFTTIKFFANGDSGWIHDFDGPEHLSDFPEKLIVDYSGNVIVVGDCNGTSSDYGVVKYYSNGDTAWSRIYDGRGGGYDYASAVDTDDEGNIYVTGIAYGGWEPNSDATTIKYYSNGDTAWARSYNGVGNSTDAARAIVTDYSGCAYVAGSTGFPRYPYCSLLIKYLPDGDIAWVTIDSASNRASFIGLDSFGNIYTAGDNITKHNSDGDVVWTREYGRPNSRLDVISAFIVDSLGNSYVSGLSWLDGSYYDYLTMKFDTNGDVLWTQAYNGPGNNVDKARGLAVDRFDNVYVTGVSYSRETYNDILTIKYVQSSTGFRGESSQMPNSSTFFHSYPNPFNKETVIKYTLAGPSQVSLLIYNLLGQRVALLVDSFQERGEHSATWGAGNLPSGIYFARLAVRSESWEIKVTLLK
jgi:hypothetical protein